MTSPQVPRFIARPGFSLALAACFGFVGCAAGGSNSGSGGSGAGSGGKGSGGSGNPGTGGSNNTGSGGSNNTGSGGSNSSGTGGSNTSGTGGSNSSGTGGSNSSGTGGSNSSGTGGGTGTGTGGSNTSGTGGGSGSTPAGYWSYAPKSWAGCSWTGIDVVAGTTTKIMPQDFTAKPAADPYCVTGTVFANYDSVALLGFNLAEPAAGASCAYKPVDTTKAGPPGVTLTGTGIAVSFSKKVASTLRVQIQGPNGASDANDRWCYSITEAAGPVFAPFNKFNTKCWDNTGSAFDPAAKKISAVVFLVPGAANAQPFDYCIGGFSTGSSAADAPAYSGGGPVTGMIGGPGAGMDIDLQRVKVAKDGKSYIIQNNNWGNPTGSDQTISYKDNSFKVVSSTGAVTGQGVPASFPSIYIGANGNTGINGAFSTRENDGLPKTVSQLQSVMSTFKYTHAPSGGRQYNASYDIWFASGIPTSEYKDGISGFVMVWLFKPSNYQPIGSKMRTATIGGATYDVWVGPRGGTMSNSNAPVVSYVAQSSVTSFSGDLKPFMTDASTNGIQSGWYLTDVFAGFEIWQGGDATGVEATEFTAIVK